MTNFEKYKKKLNEIYDLCDGIAIVDGEPVRCNELRQCKTCDLENRQPCQYYAAEWLTQKVDDEPSIEELEIEKLEKKIENLKAHNNKLAQKNKNQAVEIGNLLKRQVDVRQQGQEEAWNLANVLYSEKTPEWMREVFGIDKSYNPVAEYAPLAIILGEYTYAEAAEKVRAWEESKAIVIGDVVKNGIDSPSYGVVIYRTDMWAEGIKEDGKPFSWCIDDCTKTGRTLPVEDWLRQIGGQEE